MAINFNKYKTYDTSDGFGSAKQWRKTFSQRMGKDEAVEILKTTPETPYTILGIEPGATQTQIKTAFRELIGKWHPDKNPDNYDEATEKSKKIIAAYTILKK